MKITSKIIQQGAEAVILQRGDKIIKKRIKKSYRILELDEKIRKLRTRGEARIYEKASKLIPLPKIISSNEKTKEIIMEFIYGKKLSENLDFSKNKNQIMQQIGKSVSKLHNANLIHGDLTTSNMILKNKKVYFIDFGLGFSSFKIEDKAVDLYLLKQALEAKHFRHHKTLFKEFIKSYKKHSKDSKKIIERLKKVESRGRYKH